MNKNTTRPIGCLMVLLLLAGSPILGAAPIKLKVTAELANIRLKPSISSVIIRQIAQGEILEAVRQEGEWYLVKIDPDESGNASGYVHESLVLPLEEFPKTDRKIQVTEPVVKQADERARRTEAAFRETQAAAGGERAASAWSFTISAGGNYALGGDINKGGQGLADYLGAQLTAASGATVTPARVSFMFGGEAAIPLASWLQITIGADYFSSSKNSLVRYVPGPVTPTFAAKPQFQAVPINLALKIHPVEPFYLKLGVSFLIAGGAIISATKTIFFGRSGRGTPRPRASATSEAWVTIGPSPRALPWSSKPSANTPRSPDSGEPGATRIPIWSTRFQRTENSTPMTPP